MNKLVYSIVSFTVILTVIECKSAANKAMAEIYDKCWHPRQKSTGFCLRQQRGSENPSGCQKVFMSQLETDARKTICVCPYDQHDSSCTTPVSLKKKFKHVKAKGVKWASVKDGKTFTKKALNSLDGVYLTESLEECQRLCAWRNNNKEFRYGCESIVFGKGLGPKRGGKVPHSSSKRWNVCEIYHVKPVGNCKDWTRSDPRFKLMWTQVKEKRYAVCH